MALIFKDKWGKDKIADSIFQLSEAINRPKTKTVNSVEILDRVHAGRVTNSGFENQEITVYEDSLYRLYNLYLPNGHGLNRLTVGNENAIEEIFNYFSGSSTGISVDFSYNKHAGLLDHEPYNGVGLKFIFLATSNSESDFPSHIQNIDGGGFILPSSEVLFTKDI